MFFIALLTDRFELPRLEDTHANAPPALGAADQCRVHQLQHRPLTVEEVRDDLRLPAILDEQPLEQVGGADHLAVSDGEAQVRDARFEVILEAGGGGRQGLGVAIDHALAKRARHLERGRFVAGLCVHPEFRPLRKALRDPSAAADEGRGREAPLASRRRIR